MPYTKEISRATPACVLFLLDQSLSMEEPLGGGDKQKCEALADAVNSLLQNMILRCTKDTFFDYFDVALIGYTTAPNGDPIIGSALKGALAEESKDGFIKISRLNENPLRIEDRMRKVYDAETGTFSEFPEKCNVWLEPAKVGGTPMCHALLHAHKMLDAWTAAHMDCFPPIIFHITDGESQDGDAKPYAESVKSLATNDGNVLVFNCHLSKQMADQIIFPSSVEMLPDEFARDLYYMSSVFPESINKRAKIEGFDVKDGARGFVYNADMVSLVQFLKIGTVANVLR